MPRVVVLGASPKPDRYSHQAVLRYLDAGWEVVPIHPSASTIAEVSVVPDLGEVVPGPDIVTVYLRPERWLPLLPHLVALQPTWLWLNPGTESDDAIAAATEAGLQVVRACNLVALSIGDPLALAAKHVDG